MTISRMTEPSHPAISHSSFVNSSFVIPTGGCRIRTYEGISHQIYSLTRLTASVTPRLSRCRERRRPAILTDTPDGSPRTRVRRPPVPTLDLPAESPSGCKTSGYDASQE